MKGLQLAEPGQRLSVLCLGAHSDDIEIGAGATLLQWQASGVRLDVLWCVLSATGPREAEARESAAEFLAGAERTHIETHKFRDGFFPAELSDIKGWFEQLKGRIEPDVILTHHGNDAHQEWLNGNAAAVKIYSAVLSDAEVAAEMNRLTPVRTTNLNSYYPLQSTTTASNDFGGGNQTLTKGGTLANDASGPPVQTGFTTPKNTVLNGRVWATDPDGNPVTFSLATGSANGTVVVNANGTFTYTPTSGFSGTTSFVFRASDGMSSATATVSITVTN